MTGTATEAQTPITPTSEAATPKKDMSELFKATEGVTRMCDQILFTLGVLPVFVMAATLDDELKKSDPEKYYVFKAKLREVVDTVDKKIPELKKALEKLT